MMHSSFIVVIVIIVIVIVAIVIVIVVISTDSGETTSCDRLVYIHVYQMLYFYKHGSV